MGTGAFDALLFGKPTLPGIREHLRRNNAKTLRALSF
jgi:hypothetical protein